MAFFDLNIPFTEEGNRPSDSSTNNSKITRIKLVVKAMELGYSGIAYNRSIKGVMSDADRCAIHPLPLSSLLKVAPTICTHVKFHRNLLGAPPNSPFRQYTRLTVSVDSPIQAAALNSGNPILKTYDLIAVRPLNQIVFEQACKVSEVDLISIDFSQKLPFRIKLPFVKAAIERGIYFEITYCHLISDVHARRQMLSGVKLLVDWTRGKNLILSSAAPTANELRGPYDVANLSSLLGLSMERAKSAISMNCRSLMANALRKKQFYKEAIKVERISDDKLLDSKKAWFGDWHSWDPISSGGGDLSLDDIVSSFLAAGKGAQELNEVKVKEAPSNDRIFGNKNNLLELDTSPFFLAFQEHVVDATTGENPKQTQGLDSVLVAEGVPLAGSLLKSQISGRERDLVSPNNAGSFLYEAEGLEPTAVCADVFNNSSEIDVTSAVETMMAVPPTNDPACVGEDRDDKLSTSSKDIEHSGRCNEDHLLSAGLDVDSAEPRTPLIWSSSSNCISGGNNNLLSPNETVVALSAVKVIDHSEPYNDNSGELNGFEVGWAAGDMHMEAISAKKENMNLVACNTPLQEDTAKIELQDHRDFAAPPADDMLLQEASDPMRKHEENEILVAADVPFQEVPVKVEESKEEGSSVTDVPMLHKAKPEKGALKRKLPHQAFILPFRGLFKPVPASKKARRLKR